MKRQQPTIREISTDLGEQDAARVRRVLEGGVHIPAQPRVLNDLRTLIARHELDVRALARTINQDPGLTAMLFKVVGNAAYRNHQPFDSVEQILHAVGVEQTCNLVQAIALRNVRMASDRRVYETFWVRSQAVGELAMLIADERVAVCNIFPDQAYLAGIFHACGVPLLLQRFPTYCRELQLGIPGNWTNWQEEDRKFNTDHAVVGYLIARHWCLPDFICDAIRHQHAMLELGNHESRSMVAILQLAIDIHARDQRLPNPEWESIKPEVLCELGLGEDTFLEFVDVVLERYGARSGI